MDFIVCEIFPWIMIVLFGILFVLGILCFQDYLKTRIYKKRLCYLSANRMPDKLPSIGKWEWTLYKMFIPGFIPFAEDVEKKKKK